LLIYLYNIEQLTFKFNKELYIENKPLSIYRKFKISNQDIDVNYTPFIHFLNLLFGLQVRSYLISKKTLTVI